MPTYDYLCSDCGHHWELFQGIKDEPVRKCPKCGKNKAERQFGTGAAIVFKGSGFYQTDYRSESYKKAAEAESKPADAGKNGDGKKKSSDSKSSSESQKASKSDSSD